jgi:anti-sigma regulatory factor (Ser/Thr protein kinase)
MTSRRVSDDTLDNTVSDVSSADGAPVSPCLYAALARLAMIGAAAGPAVEIFTVEADPESVTAARHFAVATLRAWGLAELTELCDDIGLVASELVTNALRHSLPACPNERARTSIQLRLLRAAPYLLCGVVDYGAALPRRREPDYIAETGRGLHIVDSFSSRWGWSRRGSIPGKLVWAVFQLPG